MDDKRTKHKLISPPFNLSVPYKITLNCRNETIDGIPGIMSILAGNDTIIKLNDMTSTIGTRTYDGFISGENTSLVFANGDVSRCVTMFNGLILEPTSSPSLSLALSSKVDFGSIHLPMVSQTREIIFSSANLSAIPLSLSTPNTAHFSAYCLRTEQTAIKLPFLFSLKTPVHIPITLLSAEVV